MSASDADGVSGFMNAEFAFFAIGSLLERKVSGVLAPGTPRG
jgi:hypothetical protein